MSQPIRPSEMSKARAKSLPGEVIDVFNQLIVREWDGRQSVVLEKEVCRLIASRLGISSDEVYRRRLLDVEDTYRAAGWMVVYDQPAYCESYDAYFVFLK